MDPYVSFTVPAQKKAQTGWSTADIDKIYIKAKVPKDVGQNVFMLYFKNETSETYKSYGGEGQSFSVHYTPNGDYIEFVIDTSTNNVWKSMSTVTNIRVDLFDGNLGSVDQNEKYLIEIAQISFIKDYDNYVTRGGFYPFSDIEKSYPGNGSQFSETDWKNAMEDNTKVDVLSSRSIYNPEATAEELIPNLYFGVVMEFDFYIPVDKKVNGEDLTYYFNGDDDLWVFIDNELALDIGGGHGGITGSINLTTGKSTVKTVKQVTGYNTVGKLENNKETNIPDELTTPGKHTMKIFYMERCGSVSNCFMKFNLPQTPQGAVTVSKSVQDSAGNNVDLLKDQEFTFTISGTFNDKSETQLDVRGLSYQLFDSKTVKTTKETVGEGGTFTLTATQTAVFDIDENYNVTVEETEPSLNTVKGYQYQKTTANGGRGLLATQLTKKDGKLSFAFVNTYDPQYGALEIIKTGISPVDNKDDKTEQQSTLYQVTGTSDSGVVIDMTVTIVGNGSTVVQHLPVGKYTVTEVTDWSWRYDIDAKSVDVTVKGGKIAENAPKAEFKNNRAEDKWLSGDCYTRNWWGKFDKNADAAAVK